MAAKSATEKRSNGRVARGNSNEGAADDSRKKNSATATDEKSDDGGSPRWTFLTNHSHVLVLLHRDPDIVLREVAIEVGITERAVQRIVQDLESGGFIERERVGRRNRYNVLTEQPLRHPIESHRKIGDLLKLVSEQSE